MFDVLEPLRTISPQHHIILLGDFNFQDISWQWFVGSSLTSRFLCNYIIDLSSKQFVAFPTHSKGSILELVFSSYPSSVINLRNSTSISDHFLVTFEIEEQIRVAKESCILS